MFAEEGLWLSGKEERWIPASRRSSTGGSPSRATAETRSDLDELFDMLRRLNMGHPAPKQVVLTPFWVVAGPDYDGMRDAGCPGLAGCSYRELWWHNSSGGIARSPYERGDLREHYRLGFQEGLWHPEYHGRSHFDADAWVGYLKQDDPVSSLYFNNGMTYYHYGFRNSTSGSYYSLHSEYLSDDKAYQKEFAELQRWVQVFVPQLGGSLT
eukprot:767529-Hanusia_phi.AAC.2